MKCHRAILASVLLCLVAAVHAQGWSPQKNVEIVVPSAPGGTNDKLARQMERTLTTEKLVNTSLTVVHKAGGGGQIAYAYVSPRAGDPHYLMIVAPTLLTAHITGSSKLNYTDFTPIATIFNDYMVFAVNAASTVKVGKDLMARMRTDAQSMTLGFSSALGNARERSAAAPSELRRGASSTRKFFLIGACSTSAYPRPHLSSHALVRLVGCPFQPGA